MNIYTRSFTQKASILQRAFSSAEQSKHFPEFLGVYQKLFEKSKILEQILPRQIKDVEQLVQVFPGSVSAKSVKTKNVDIQSINEGLLDPAYDLLNRGGKRWRPSLGLMIAEAYGRKIENFEENKDVYYIQGLTELIHNGSLMIDDLEDNSLQRRGEPCTHIKYGPDYAVNAGNFMYYAPLLHINKFVNKNLRAKFYDVYVKELVNLHIGQNWDIHWHHGKVQPNLQNYLDMVVNKTSVLPRINLQMLSLVLKLKRGDTLALEKYLNGLGTAFQIQDDIIALKSEEYIKTRGLGEDIREGKRSLMVIRTLSKNKKRNEKLTEILNKRDNTEEELAWATKLLKENGSIEYADKIAKGIMEKSWKLVQVKIPEGPAKANLEKLSKFIIERQI
eukprot:403358352